MTCAVTLASMPLQVGVNECLSVLVADGKKWPTPLHSCNLRSLHLIPSYWVFEFGTRVSNARILSPRRFQIIRHLVEIEGLQKGLHCLKAGARYRGFSSHYSESQRHFGLGARLYTTSSDCAQHGTSALPLGSQRF